MRARSLENRIALLLPIIGVQSAGVLQAAPIGSEAPGQSLPLFGSVPLLLVHLAAVAPLGIALYLSLKKRIRTDRSNVLAASFAVSGGFTLWAAQSMLQVCFRSLGNSGATEIQFAIARCILALCWILPWCAFLGCWGSQRKPGVRIRSFDLGLCIAVAFVLPLLYARHIENNKYSYFQDLLGSSRLVSARHVLCQLVAMGGAAPKQQNGTYHHYLGQLDKLIAQHELAVESSIHDIPIKHPFQIAEHLVALERLPEALATIDQSGKGVTGEETPRRINTVLLKASILQRLQKWQESIDAYRQAEQLLHNTAKSHDVDSLSLARAVSWRRVYNGLAYDLRELGKIKEAQAVYEHALLAFSDDENQQAYSHFQLGLHYQRFANRPLKAAHHFQKAAQLNPQAYREPVKQIMQNDILPSTPACILFRGMTR